MDELQGIVRFTFHPGMVEEFKRLSAECLEIVHSKDLGTLQYDTYFNDDESQAIVLERFRDSDALILHGQNMAPLMEAIMATGTVSGELLGAPTSSSGAISPATRSVYSRCTSRCSGRDVQVADACPQRRVARAPRRRGRNDRRLAGGTTGHMTPVPVPAHAGD